MKELHPKVLSSFQTIGQEVIVNDPNSEMYDEIGEVCGVRTYSDGGIKISVRFEETVKSFMIENLLLN